MGVRVAKAAVGRLRVSLAGLVLPRDGTGRLRLAVDVTPWPRPDAECSSERLHCHRPCRCDGVRQTIPGGEIGAHPVHDIPTSPVWSRGPVVLIGDAGHATSPSAGQGASIACEDAITLAKCLRDLPEPTAAFAAYERLRRERVEKIVAYARKRGSNKTAGPVARVFRDLMMPIVLKHFASEKAHAWMYEYHIDWDERVRV